MFSGLLTLAGNKGRHERGLLYADLAPSAECHLWPYGPALGFKHSNIGDQNMQV